MKKRWIGFWVILIFSAWLLIGLAPYLIMDNTGVELDDIWAMRGQVGDMFGAVNSLFSGLAFAGLIYTVCLQRKELQLQRRELALTRREVKRSASAQIESEKALRKQAGSLQLSANISALDTLIRAIDADMGMCTGANRSKLDFKKKLLVSQLEGIINRDSE